jgi:cyanophycin synthetase
MAELGASHADEILIVHKKAYLRGRDPAELTARLREGAAAVGVTDVGEAATELEGLQELVGRSRAGDVVALMCHQDRPLVDAWLRSEGATVDGPDQLREKVRAARA